MTAPDIRMSFGPVSADAWNGLLAESTQASVFNRRDFLQSLGTRLCYWGVFDCSELLAAASVQTDSNGITLSPNASFNFYHGIMLSPDVTGLPEHTRTRRELAVIDRLVTGLSEVHDEIWLNLHPRLRDVRALQWFNYHTSELGQFQIDLRYTGLLDLRKVTEREALIANLARVRQRNGKRAVSQGIQARESMDVALLDELHAKTYGRTGAPRGSFDRQLRPMTSAAMAGGFGELLVAYTADGVPASATFFVWDQATSYYLFGATDPVYRDTGAATLVMIESLWRAVKRGSNTVDFVGINSPQRGNFKTSFNAVPTPYFLAHWRRPLTIRS